MGLLLIHLLLLMRELLALARISREKDLTLVCPRGNASRHAQAWIHVQHGAIDAEHGDVVQVFSRNPFHTVRFDSNPF